MSALHFADAAHRADLAVFAERALRLDPAAVIRLRTRSDGLMAAWVATGLDVLATRVVAGAAGPRDVTYAADRLREGLGGQPSGYVDAGLPMDSAWRGALPPETGFVHVDDVPDPVIAQVAQRASQLARDHGGAHGPPAGLLDSEMLAVSGGGTVVSVPTRCVLAVVAMGFLADDHAPRAVVRVRATASWLRIDARFGSVFRRRGAPSLLLA